MFKLVVLFSVVALAAAKPGFVAPVAVGYSAAVPAVSSVSQYSSEVVHGAPAVYSAYSAPAVYGSPAVYGAPAVFGAPAVYGSPAVYGTAVAPLAVSQAPHSPAVVLDAVRGVPLDTPEVVAARAAHYQAKALSGLHHLRKRSVLAPYSSVAYTSPVVTSYGASPVVSAYSAPVVSPVVSAYSSPVVSSYAAAPYSYSAVVPRALSVHPW